MKFTIEIEGIEHDRERRQRILSALLNAIERGGTDAATENLSTTMAEFEGKFELTLSKLRDEL